jgi:flavin reductase (DIM6/NTAB) family NADH-FMN oxidoreductase RutF
MENFQRIKPTRLTENIFSLLAGRGMLITAGTSTHCNTMTAGWGGWGELWHKPVTFIYVRPTRHTFRFLEESSYYSLCFFPEKHKQVLEYCGKHSGRDGDKIKACGLTLFETGDGALAFTQADLIIANKKLYTQDLDPDRFLDQAIRKNYPKRDYHRLYVGEILSCLTAQKVGVG